MRNLFVATLMLAFSWTAVAGVHSVPKNKPLANVTLPDDWTAEEYAEGEGLAAASADGQVYVAFEISEAEDAEDAMKQAAEYLASKDVAFDEASIKKSDEKINGMDVVNISWDGEDDDGPAKIALKIVSLAGEKRLLMVGWGSPDGANKHKEELNGIAQSIRKSE